jgi:hypothetical protein
MRRACLVRRQFQGVVSSEDSEALILSGVGSAVIKIAQKAIKVIFGPTPGHFKSNNSPFLRFKSIRNLYRREKSLASPYGFVFDHSVLIYGVLICFFECLSRREFILMSVLSLITQAFTIICIQILPDENLVLFSAQLIQPLILFLAFFYIAWRSFSNDIRSI